MIKLTEETLEQNYNTLLSIVNKYITGERKDKVLSMIEKMGEEFLLAPASGKNWYHGAYPGGFLIHTINVARFAIKLTDFYRKAGGNIDFTDEELIFSALFHDLGKLGDGDKANFLVQNDDWRRKNLGECYVNNPDLDFMLVPDRSLFILQKFGITVDQKEWLAIKLHDGMFDEANKAYYVSYRPESKLKTNLVPILHAADYLAAKVELDREIENSQEN